MEDDGPVQESPRQGKIVSHSPGSSRPLSRQGSISSSQFRASIRAQSLAQAKLRKMRAAALGKGNVICVRILYYIYMV